MTGLAYGASLVARQEFRIRLRTGRWRWLLAGWVALVGAFTLLVDLALSTGYGYETDTSRRGVPVFGILMFFVLAMVMVISPALTSQTVNGDRERGTLATLQVTLLRPAELAVGKLLAGWGVGLVMLALTLPFTGYAILRGGLTIDRIAAVYGVVALLIGAVCAVSQALSALLARSITSALLSYLAVFALTVGTLIAFVLATALVTTKYTYTNTDSNESYTINENRPDLVWWLLAPNPFVVLADSTPRVPPRYSTEGDTVQEDQYDILSAVGNEVRAIRRPPNYRYAYAYSYTPNGEVIQPVQVEDKPIWPWGLGFDLLVGAAALAVTIRRLRTPTRKLGRGVRIA